MRSGSRRIAVLAAVVGFAMPVVVSSPALAHGVDRRGNCSANSDWRLRAEIRDWRIEVRGKVTSGVDNQSWTWRILHNGATSARGSKATHNGEFEVERTMYDADGPDRVGWRAHNARTGESCKGSLTI